MSFDEFDRPRRKRRTRAHVIEDLSENYLERKVLLQGHWLLRPKRDYGVDVTMFHFAKTGEVENGEVRFQLKATERLKVLKKANAISVTIAIKDLHYWAAELYPFILVVFDAAKDRAYWVCIQEYVTIHPDLFKADQETVSVQIPIANKLTQRSIELFRSMSLKAFTSIEDLERIQNVKRKPR